MSPAPGRARAALGLLVAVLGSHAPAPDGAATDVAWEDAPCLVTAAVEPDPAFVGQQVLYRLRIATRPDVAEIAWLEPPSFPGLRVERLPGTPQAGEEMHGRVRYRVREEQRALFGERAGSLALGGARIACRTRDGDEVATPVPPAALRLREPPPQGRPAAWNGLVGPLALDVRVGPRVVALGGSVRVEVTLRGLGNLWDAADPLGGAAALGDAELFRERPALSLEPGTRLFVQRRFAYDVVPRRVGALEIPALAVPYFDPGTGAYAWATAPAATVRVGPGAGAPRPAAPASRGADAAGRDGGAPLPALLGALAAIAAVAGLAAALRARRRGAGLAAALADARAARAAGEPDREAGALVRALRLARERAGPDARADALLADLERSRFDPSTRAPERADVERTIARLRRAAWLRLR